MFNVIQDIYPVSFRTAGAGQIIFKFSVVDQEQQAIVAQVQYLMDLDLATTGNANDNPPITTRYGYVSNWASFSNGSAEPVPPYYIATLDAVTNNNFPTLVAMGYNTDLFAPEPMGLIPPQAFTYVDWPTIVHQWTWGFPTPLHSKDSDAAVLIEWPLNNIDTGMTVELGRGSFGSASCTPVSIGNLDLMTVHPSHIAWDPVANAYVPNHFPVDGIVWNPSVGQTRSAMGTQSITNVLSQGPSGPIQITSPLPTTNSGYTQQQSSTAGDLAAGCISWEDTLLQSIPMNCSSDSSYSITFNIVATGNIDYSGQCECPIVVDCQDLDVLPPRHSAHIAIGSVNHCDNYTKYIDSVFDDRSNDVGLQSISWNIYPSASAIEVDTGIHEPCTNAKVPITITQVDSLHAPCVFFTFTDCIGNVSYDTICFPTCSTGTFNSFVPEFWLHLKSGFNGGDDSSCDFESSAWIASDSLPDDGIDSLLVVDSANMTAIILGYTEGAQFVQFEVFALDTNKPGHIVLKAVDEKNRDAFDTINYCAAPASVGSSDAPPISLSIFPSPIENTATILISGAPSADVEIFDVLGREVDRFLVDGSYDWETSGLPKGTYIIRANANGPGNSQPITKRIVKE